MALAKHLRAQPAAGGDAEPLRLALPWRKTTTYQKRPTPRRVREINEGRSQPVDERTQGRHRAVHDLPEESSASSFDCAWTNDGERKKSSEGTGCDGAALVPVPSGSSAPASR